MTEKLFLDPEAAKGLRRDLKAVFTDFAAGKGGTFQLLNQIERIVKCVCKDPDRSLGKASNCMRKFIKEHARERIENTGLPGIKWDSLYSSVTKHRNDIAHTGTEAALAGARTAALATVLLDALLDAGRKKGCPLKISEVMVANPTCAENWQTLADLRRTMLVNDFSILPMRNGKCGEPGKWRAVRAGELAAYLLDNRKGHRETLGCALDNGLKPYCATVVCEDEKLADLRDRNWAGKGKGNFPSSVVVTSEKKDRLVGIATAFDLL